MLRIGAEFSLHETFEVDYVATGAASRLGNDIGMPRHVIANQLTKLERDLRFLSMKAVEHSGEGGARPHQALMREWNSSNGVLESIIVLLYRLQADIHPKLPLHRTHTCGHDGTTEHAS